MATVCVFCGSSAGVDPRHRESARALGTALATRGHLLVYGGGRVGLMGALADAVVAAGGTAIGVIPRFLEAYEVAHRGLSSLEVVESMHARKERMSELADAFVVLGGGFGTLDETFEILTWKQLGLHAKPVVLIDVAGLWAPLATLANALVSSGFVRPEHLDLFRIVPSVDAALEVVEHAPRTTGSIASKLT